MKNTFLFLCLLILNNAFNQELTVERIWKNGQFGQKYLAGFNALSDGQSFTRTVSEGSNSLLKKYSFNDFNGAGTTLVNLSTIQFEGKTVAYDDVKLSESGKLLILQMGTESIYRHSFSTDYYLYNIDSKVCVKVHKGTEKQTLATLSPDETQLAYITDNNLFVYTISNKKTTQITSDGKYNEIINGTCDWVYEEEFGFTQGFEWSPDSKYIAYLRFDESKVKQFQMAMYGELYPSQYTFKYPKAGEDNSKVEMYISPIASNAGKKVALGNYEYLPRFAWTAKNNELIILSLNRHQSELNYHIVNNVSSPVSKVFFTEKSSTYIDIDNTLSMTSDGKSLFRTSEADGYNHIYQLFFDGKQNQLTKGNWDVIEFYGYDEKKKTLFYASAEPGAIYKSIYSQSLDGKKKKTLSPTNGTNSAEFSPGFNYFILTRSDANTPNSFSLCDRTGKVIKLLEENKELKDKLAKENLSKKEFSQIKGADGTLLNAWMIKPPNFDPAKKYPVYINIYCGPGSNTVQDEFEGANYMYHQLLAQKGYIVYSVDPRGTMFRGAAFKKSTYLELGKLETEDLIAVAKNLQNMPFIDKDRIGIQGWSYGGFMTSLCMTKGADVFKTGISVAPVTNWRYYDNIYTERFMRTPAENASGYDDNSPTSHASKLKGKFLLIHGSADDNVHYQNSMEFIDALVKANKQFDLFIYPNKNHGIYGGNTRNHLYTMMLNYTLENL